MFADYIRNEETVSVALFDGSEEMMQELKTENPDLFEIRVSGGGPRKKPSLIVKDGRSYMNVVPGDFVVFDSCGRVMTYAPDFFEFMFRRVGDEQSGIHDVAAKLYAADKGDAGDFDGEPDAVRASYLNQAKALLRDFYVVRR